MAYKNLVRSLNVFIHCRYPGDAEELVSEDLILYNLMIGRRCTARKRRCVGPAESQDTTPKTARRRRNAFCATVLIMVLCMEAVRLKAIIVENW